MGHYVIKSAPSRIATVSPVAGHTEWIVTDCTNGDVHLYDINDGALVYIPFMDIHFAGVHVRKIVTLELCVRKKLVAALSRLMCTYDDRKKVAIVKLDG